MDTFNNSKPDAQWFELFDMETLTIKEKNENIVVHLIDNGVWRDNATCIKFAER